MEVTETVPVLFMCRLCLNYAGDCIEIDTQNVALRKKMKIYLNLEIRHDEPFPKTVCQECIDRIEAFDKFCAQVTKHQLQLLQLSKLKDENIDSELIATSTNLIRLSPAIVSTKENGTILITVQTRPTSDAISLDNSQEITPVEDKRLDRIPVCALKECNIIGTDEFIVNSSYEICGHVEKQADTKKNDVHNKSSNRSLNKNAHLKSVRSNFEKTLDNLATDDIAAQIQEESDEEDLYNADENDSQIDTTNAIDSLKIDRKNFKDFPTKLIEDSKLMYKGRDLLEMISKFYRLECDQCHIIFKSISNLCQHYVEYHQIKGYVICCNTKLVKPRAMALHMARHLQPDAFKCPECKKMLTCPKILKYHLQNHLPESERPLECAQCPRRFSYSSALVAHSISHQPESQRAAHVCDECGKVFVSAGRLTTHINVSHIQQTQDYICHICAKKFACRSNLTYHLTTHQPNVRQVQCSKCQKWLKNKLCLRKHMVQHSSIRYNCEICDYSALNRQCLRNHVRVQHTNDKPYSCEVCGKTFKLKNVLITHSAQHTGLRKFVCPFCKRTFASSGNFYSHRKRMHPQELATMKLKQQEDERRLREKAKNTTKT